MADKLTCHYHKVWRKKIYKVVLVK